VLKESQFIFDFSEIMLCEFRIFQIDGQPSLKIMRAPPNTTDLARERSYSPDYNYFTGLLFSVFLARCFVSQSFILILNE
jgi:hypothetical protein